jgi:hypothetical protein
MYVRKCPRGESQTYVFSPSAADKYFTNIFAKLDLPAVDSTGPPGIVILALFVPSRAVDANGHLSGGWLGLRVEAGGGGRIF